MGKKKKDIIRLERESVIPILKHKLITALSLFFDRSERDEFLKFCQRVEYTIRAWYHLHFEDLLQLYALFEPIHGAHRLEQQKLTHDKIDALEQKFVLHLFEVMDKSNFKVITDEELEVALSAQYRLNLPIVVDETRLDKKLLTSFFTEYPRDNLPHFADKYIIFRRGFGIDHMTAYFFEAKVNTIVFRIWNFFLTITGLTRLVYGKKQDQPSQHIDIKIDSDKDSLYIERIRIEKLKLSISNLLKKITIQEPTFERIIVVYRRVAGKRESERNVYVKHFKSIPMADMEIVLPEKKNPGLTPLDWVKFLVSAAIGLTTVISSVSLKNADIRVIVAILSTLIGYCVKTYFTFQRNLVDYQSLITRSVYDKQLDSGRGSLLHLCDEVIQQEVKEVIISFFMLMRQERATSKEELDEQSEAFMKQEFNENCNFDVDDAVKKLEKLGLVSRDAEENYRCVDLKKANELIGTTTEELVLKARGGESNNGTNMENQNYEHQKQHLHEKEDIIQSNLDEFEAFIL
ncbi:PREDICTED: uncharacterized protein LOC104802361 isoform X2 [Tarenaya hassleriana]|uniref:uncharacterized protein LOC104802361 isoform X2 n=1 Tax=Tarenaya hassleriana TaxID=28532 RepID=UPI00053C1433|nr:PREDICTED: uncharacterized protein LOC104802361 isoform X2 [Tarenaya hassleriana]